MQLMVIMEGSCSRNKTTESPKRMYIVLNCFFFSFGECMGFKHS